MSVASTKPAPPIALGTVVAEKYRVETLLGEGGMGFVFAALHLQLGHRVALKVLHSSQISDREVTERFLREGRALARLQGEHIARVSDVGTLPSGEPYLVMEFLEGQDLSRELAARGPLPIADVVSYIAQTCEALAEAHVRGIVHRDLKPANLFLTHKLDGEPSIKVLDFGISKVAADGVAVEVENITVTSTLVGTPKYMSPEQIQDSRSVDSRTDIWGLGTIFYELLTKQRPFTAPTLALVCVKVLHEEVPAPSTIRAEIPPGIDAIIARCLKKSSADRYAHVGELVEALIPFGDPSVRASAARITRILAARTSSKFGADSSGSLPGLTSVPSSLGLLADSNQPLSHTPSAVRVDREVATLAVDSAASFGAPKRSRRKLGLIAAGVVLAIAGVLFLTLRSKTEQTGTTNTASAATHSVAPPEPPPTHVAVEPTATTTSAASVASTAVTVKSHGIVHPPPNLHHTATAATTQATSAPTPTQTATATAPPKGTGDVLEDRR